MNDSVRSVDMAEERFLVTGALGCIGSWAVKRLVEEGVPVTTYDLPGDPYRMRLIMDNDAINRVDFVQGDITDESRFMEVVREKNITHILHLAALQVPFVRANPILGARVNVVGTAIVFETARMLPDQIEGLVYASSIAVYGTPDLYPPGPLADDAPLAPVTLYGVTKEANEGWASVYWQDYGLASVGLRPFFVYGPGRDQGVSSTPTKAMAAAAMGRPYHISFGGTDTYQHADDVARAFIAAARTNPHGAPVYNLGGTLASVDDVVSAIEHVVPESAGTITFNAEPLFTPNGVEGKAVEALLGPIAWRPLVEGVRDTIDVLRTAAAAGRLDVDRAIA
ncbi:MAG TPA: NAD-dependent epimerase/dehydratase family protein [Thermomicrobiales bacterium]|nr:NAD-dependent epimerase/dehydratase family protein [Thermomicrobiales bacterium]